VTEEGLALPEEPVYKADPWTEGQAPQAPPLGPHLREAINLVQALEPPIERAARGAREQDRTQQ
jgi:hypothetical protein